MKRCISLGEVLEVKVKVVRLEQSIARNLVESC